MATLPIAFFLAIGSQEADPVARAQGLFGQGDAAGARALLAKEGQAEPARSSFLLARICVAEGNPAGALEILEKDKLVLSRLSPWVDLLAAEAGIRTGAAKPAGRDLRRLLEEFGGNRRFAEECLNLLLMSEFLGQVPDEPVGLVSNADIGSALAARLGLGAAAGEPAAEKRLESHARERFPTAPILTLAGGAKRPVDRPEGGYILAAFLPARQVASGGLFQEELLPLAYRYGPLGRLRIAVIIHIADSGEIAALVQNARTLDSRGETVVLWTPRRDAFISYGVTRPPFLLLTSLHYERGVLDWEPPWGTPRVFFRRLEAMLRAESAAQ